jgi:ribosomal protein S18 acetylase RimI-like enzyme
MSALGHGGPMFRVHITRPLKENDISLRPVRIFDAAFLHSGFSSRDFLEANGLSKPIASSWFPTWWWLRRTFVFAYCIVADGKRAGFLGMHTLRPGESAELSLSIFEEEMRRKGYGSRAFHLFVRNLEKHFFIKMLLVRVRKDNFMALSFWKKLGFGERRREGAVIVLFYTVRPSTTIPIADSPASVQTA